MGNESGLLPVEFYVVVELDPVPDRVGSILMPETTQAADKLAAQEGTLVAASPLAFTYEKWPEGSRAPQVGDRVLFKRYEGHSHERSGRNYKLLNDKSIIAIMEQPAETREEMLRRLTKLDDAASAIDPITQMRLSGMNI